MICSLILKEEPMCSTLSGLLEFSPVLLRYFISGMGLLLELDSVHIQQCCSVNYQHIVKVPSATYSKEASFFVILYDKTKTKKQRRRGMVIFPDVLGAFGKLQPTSFIHLQSYWLAVALQSSPYVCLSRSIEPVTTFPGVVSFQALPLSNSFQHNSQVSSRL